MLEEQYTPHLNAAASHAELGLSASCKKGDKHLFLSKDPDPNTFVEGQEDRLQGRGSQDLVVPVPLPNLGTLLIQTAPSGSV